ncbi:MAG TPA: isochorismatase family cysteine hydrolase [Candidatus Binataceae bacterium]|nr:isochorismatase family cysteine hydrolase [Candidatus Binataceae bacterium]
MFKLNPAKSALLIINMSNDLLGWEGVEALVPGLARLIKAARARGMTVVYSSLAFCANGTDSGQLGRFWEMIGNGKILTKDTPGVEICSELAPAPGDIVLQRNRYSAFYNTELDNLLRSRGIDTVVIGGYSTNFCCDSTARDANFRDYNVVFLSDGTAPIALQDDSGANISGEEVQKTELANLRQGIARVASVAEAEAALRE